MQQETFKKLNTCMAWLVFAIAAILYGLIPGVVKFGGWFELLFTNVLGCPYNTGLICYILLLTGTIIIAYYKVKQRIVIAPMLCLAGYLLIILGILRKR